MRSAYLASAGINEVRTGFTQKRCPKCGGNVFLDRYPDGWYEQCLQCGHTLYLETIVDARVEAGKGILSQAKRRGTPVKQV